MAKRGYVHHRLKDKNSIISAFPFRRCANVCAMRTGGMLDGHEFGKRVRRFLDGNYSYRKILLFILICCALLLYFGPPIAQWLFSTVREPIEAFEDHCINERLASFYFDAAEYNANILHNPPKENEYSYLPYILVFQFLQRVGCILNMEEPSYCRYNGNR